MSGMQANLLLQGVANSSPWLSTEQLLAPAKQNALIERNSMLNRMDQQTMAANEIEYAARAAQGLLGLGDEAAMAAAYPGAVSNAQQYGFLKNAPSVFPGKARLEQIAAMGTSSEKQAALRLAGSAIPMPGFAGQGAAAPGATTGATTGGTPLPIPARGTGGPGASTAMPPEYLQYFREASAETGIPVDLLIAQARQESSFNPNARGGAGEIGIFQIKPSTAQSPGFGLSGVDPGTLSDPRNNILFGARYLKARMGQGDPNNPADQARALAAYNGGGDPNYVANVNRYRPGMSPTDPGAAVTTYTQGGATGGVAARTGGTNVAGPPGTVPPGADPVAVAPVAAPGTATTAQPPPATTTAPAVAMPAPPAPLDNNNLTRQDYADLQRARASGMTGPQLSQEVQQRQNANITRQQQYETRVQQAQQHAQTQANEAERQRIARQTADLALQKAQREEADRALRGPSGDALTNQDRRMLLSAYDNPEAVKTPDYAAAYANLATPRVAEGGLQIQPDMTPFKLPQDKDGNPILSYGQPKLVIGPGDLSKYRAIDEQFSTITYTLDTLKKAWNDASAVERAETLAGKPTALRTAWTNAALLAKGQGLFELGVISGPDKTLLQGALADPSTVWGAFTGSATAGKQIDMVKDLLSQRRAAAQRAYGGGMAIGSGPQSGPVSGTVAPASAAGGWTVKRID